MRGMDTIAINTVGLLVAAIGVALIARRLALPYTVGLVAAGVGLALLRLDSGVALTRDVIFDVILPPLLFEAAINIQWKALCRNAWPVLTLALPGTLVAAAVVATGMVFVLGWPIPAAAVFGALIAATDPVAVIAMFKDNGVSGRARLLVESESLFNDGVAAVLFTLVFEAFRTTGAGMSAADVARALLLTVGGGTAIGLLCASALLVVVGRTSDHLVESTMTTVVAYGSFLLAEHFHASGVLATVAAGLLIGNLAVSVDYERSRMTPRAREFVIELWEFIAFIANSLVFLLIGLAVAAIPFGGFGVGTLFAVVGIVLFSRAVTVYPLCLPFRWSHVRVPLGTQHVLWWGGLRGALGLALALSLPLDFAFRGQILIATFGVVVFSVVVQGLTMPMLLRRVGIVPTE